jgi:hypothetical protein
MPEIEKEASAQEIAARPHYRPSLEREALLGSEPETRNPKPVKPGTRNPRNIKPARFKVGHASSPAFHGRSCKCKPQGLRFRFLGIFPFLQQSTYFRYSLWR